MDLKSDTVDMPGSGIAPLHPIGYKRVIVFFLSNSDYVLSIPIISIDVLLYTNRIRESVQHY